MKLTQEEHQTAQAFNELFGTTSGRIVMEYLVNYASMDIGRPGRADVVLMILQQRALAREKVAVTDE